MLDTILLKVRKGVGNQIHVCLSSIGFGLGSDDRIMPFPRDNLPLFSTGCFGQEITHGETLYFSGIEGLCWYLSTIKFPCMSLVP